MKDSYCCGKTGRAEKHGDQSGKTAKQIRQVEIVKCKMCEALCPHLIFILQIYGSTSDHNDMPYSFN